MPVSGDTFAINSGVDVEMDVDQSGMAAGMGASTITGTLHFKRAAGTYILKMNGNLSGAGIIDASDGAGGAYVGGQIAQITFNTTSIVCSVSGVQNVRCLEPVHQYVKLSQAESSTATVLHVDTDITGEPTYWKAGDLIRIDNINQAVESEERTILSVTSTTITITAGLTNSKLIGSYVILATRNVKVVGAGTGGASIAFSAPGAGSVISAEIRLVNAAYSATVTVTIGGAITNVTTVFTSNPGNLTFSGVVSSCTTFVNAGFGFILTGLVSACTNGMSQAIAFYIAAAAIITGCASAITACSSALIQGSVLNSTNGFVGSSGILQGATLSNNAADLRNVGNAQLFNTLLGSTTEFGSYNLATRRALQSYVESSDHDQVANAFRAWTLGGITSSIASPVYDASRSRSYNAVCESASNYAFFQRQVLVPPGGSVYVRCYVQKDASMSFLPRVQIFASSKEPLLSGSADATATMTNSTNTWEVLEATVTNSTDAPVLYTVRMLAQNASGNVYWDPIIRPSSFQIDTGMIAGMAA